MACTCQGCGTEYTMDVVVDDEIWEQIKPSGKPEGAGLLCGACITERVEALHEHSAYRLMHLDSTDA